MVDVDVETRGLADAEGVHAMRQGDPGLALQIEMHHGFGAGDLGYVYLALDERAIAMAVGGMHVMRSHAEFVGPVAQRQVGTSGCPAGAVREA